MNVVVADVNDQESLEALCSRTSVVINCVGPVSCPNSWHKQGRIEPPSAARGHATSNCANIDSIALNVTKNRGRCPACKTAHTIEVLISIT